MLLHLLGYFIMSILTTLSKGVILHRSLLFWDLWVLHDYKLQLNFNIDDLFSKDNRSLGLILHRPKDFSGIKSLKKLYCTYVRCKLDYSFQIWNPCYFTHIDDFLTTWAQVRCKFFYMTYGSKQAHSSPYGKRHPWLIYKSDVNGATNYLATLECHVHTYTGHLTLQVGTRQWQALAPYRQKYVRRNEFTEYVCNFVIS